MAGLGRQASMQRSVVEPLLSSVECLSVKCQWGTSVTRCKELLVRVLHGCFDWIGLGAWICIA